MIVRKATDDDLIETLQWMLTDYRLDEDGVGFWHNRNIIVNAQCTGRAFVARAKGRCIGLAVVSGRCSEVDIVAVHPDHRRGGIGRALISHCVKLARQHDSDRLSAECVTREGRALCEALGFRQGVRPGYYTLPLEDYFG